MDPPFTVISKLDSNVLIGLWVTTLLIFIYLLAHLFNNYLIVNVQEVVGSNPGPAEKTICHAPLIWIKSMKAKIVEKITWHCCMCCNNPGNGRKKFKDSWVIKFKKK